VDGLSAGWASTYIITLTTRVGWIFNGSLSCDATALVCVCVFSSVRRRPSSLCYHRRLQNNISANIVLCNQSCTCKLTMKKKFLFICILFNKAFSLTRII
jgi:hypothetical protein